MPHPRPCLSLLRLAVASLAVAVACCALSPAALALEPPPAVQPNPVRVIWRFAPPSPDLVALTAGPRSYTLRDPHRHANAAVREAFARAASAFDPPWPLQVEVDRFALTQLPQGARVSLTVTVVDARDGTRLLHTSATRTVDLADSPSGEVFGQRLTEAFAAVAGEVATALVHRQQGGTLPDRDDVPGNRFGLVVGAPVVGALAWRHGLGTHTELELGMNPGVPLFAATVGLLRRVPVSRQVGFHYGGGAALAFPIGGSCSSEAESAPVVPGGRAQPIVVDDCGQDEPSLAYLHFRVGLALYGGASRAHALGLDVGYWAGWGWLGGSDKQFFSNPMAGVSYFYGF